MALKPTIRRVVDRTLLRLTPGEEARLQPAPLLRMSREFKARLDRAKAAVKPRDFEWYPYDSFSSLYPLKTLFAEANPLPAALHDGLPIADVGCGDGDLSFFLESLGGRVDAIDCSNTNYNRMAGVRALKNAMASNINIHDIDLDQQFALPAASYSLILFLGALYHLKNPFYALEALARHGRYCCLSTRVARNTPDHRLHLDDYPVAYLLDPNEANNDPTNYWIFSNAGLRRLLERAGWTIRAYCNTGSRDSDPSSQERDERAFCVLESRRSGMKN